MRVSQVILAVLMMAGTAMADPRQIVVQGTGVVETIPDMAVVTIGVQHQADTAGSAMAQVAATSTAVFARLDKMGIAARDMQTSDLSLNPVWNRDRQNNKPPRVIGFAASNRVTIRVRDLDSLGQVLDAVVRDGANQFNGVQFSLQEPAALQNDARRRAVFNARAKADLYAEAAGVTLGPLLSLSEQGSSAPRPVMMARAAMDSGESMPVAAGEVSLRAAVTMVFAIDD